MPDEIGIDLMKPYHKDVQTQPVSPLKGSGDSRFDSIIFVILLGFVIRLFDCMNVGIINPDGPLYIHQARAFYYGQWGQITSCAPGHISLYPLLISWAYGIFHDWILSARAVSLIFGTLSILPIYLLARKFLDRPISLLTTLMASLIPVLVFGSVDVIRDPVAWFFTAFGVYYFVLQFDPKSQASLSLSCLCFLLAALNRAEIIIFLGSSLLYILLFQREKKFQRILFFLAPFIILIPMGALVLGTINLPITDVFRTHEMVSKLSSPIYSYIDLRDALAAMIHQPHEETLVLFLEKARNLVWFIGIATLIVYAIRAFFYPFFFIFILGIPGISGIIKRDKRIVYLFMLCLFMLVMLYFHLLHTWLLDARFFVPLMIPACVFMGFGLRRVVHFMASRFNLKPQMAFFFICLLILAFGLPKNLDSRETDKLVFKNIATTIAQREGSDRVINVASSMDILRWISFYANLNYPGCPCPEPYIDFKSIVGGDYKHFVDNLRERGIKYFIWQEKQWPKHLFDFIHEFDPRDFNSIGYWTHPDTGRLVLFEVTG